MVLKEHQDLRRDWLYLGGQEGSEPLVPRGPRVRKQDLQEPCNLSWV